MCDLPFASIPEGDTSPKVRTWLAEAEREEAQRKADLARIDEQAQQRPRQIHPSRAKQALQDPAARWRRVAYALVNCSKATFSES
jgi:hypothetical protein